MKTADAMKAITDSNFENDRNVTVINVLNLIEEQALLGSYYLDITLDTNLTGEDRIYLVIQLRSLGFNVKEVQLNNHPVVGHGQFFVFEDTKYKLIINWGNLN